MRRIIPKQKPSFLIQPDLQIDKKYESQDQNKIIDEISKCKNGLNGLKYFINEYIYVQNKIKPEILKEKPNQFKHLIFEKEKINLKLYAKQEEYLETLYSNRLTATYKSRQCLPKSSLIYTPEGPKEIQNIVAGDVVYSYNEEYDEIEIDIVEDCQMSGTKECESICQSNGKQTEQGRNHPFMLADNKQKRSRYLWNGDKVRYFNYDGEYEHNTTVVYTQKTGEKECQDIETQKNKNYIFEGFIVHNTGISTITQAYALQYALFNENKEIVIISKSEAEAIKFLGVIYYMYNHLPFFLRRKPSMAVKKAFHIGPLNTATKITVLTSTAKSGRSFSATVLVLDECEFIDHIDDLWSAAQPTLSATGGQAICISTPQQYKSWFYRMCHGEGEEGKAFIPFKIRWSDIPGRDEEQYKDQCAELGHDPLKIQTELNLEQIIPFQKYYSEDYLKLMVVLKRSELYKYEKNMGLGILFPPVSGLSYYFGIDPYEGGLDNNAGIIVGEDMKIYAYFKTKQLNIFNMIKILCDSYDTKFCVEKNRGFWLVKEFMNAGIAKKYALYRLIKRKNIYDEQFGFIVNGDNRSKLITSTADYLKGVHDFNKLSPKDTIYLPEDLLEEMKYFVIKKSKIQGLDHDDLIFALIAALYVRDNKAQFYNWKTDKKSNALSLVDGFYGIVNSASHNSILSNGKINTLVARNFLSGIRSGKNLTPDQLDMLDMVLKLGKNEVEQSTSNIEK